MKFTISRETFLPALQAINNVVEKRLSLPILGNVLIHGEKERIRLTATDMEVELSIDIESGADVSGSVTVPARKLFDICRALPAEARLIFQVQGDKVRIQSGRSRFTLGSMRAEEFPNVGAFDISLAINGLDIQLLRSLVEGTQFAMAHQDVRYYLNGLLLEMGDGRIRAVATDGHRLAMCTRDVAQLGENKKSIIVPRKGVVEIGRMLAFGNDGEVAVVVGDNHLQVSIPGQILTTKLIDGRFPDYERVIPREGEKSVLAQREALRAGLARASILSNEKFKGVRVLLSANTIKAVAHNPEQEEAEEEIEVEYEGESLEIGFNVSYLLDVLGVLKCPKVRMDFIDANSSCVLRDPADDDARYVVMPMRL